MLGALEKMTRLTNESIWRLTALDMPSVALHPPARHVRSSHFILQRLLCDPYACKLCNSPAVCLWAVHRSVRAWHKRSSKLHLPNSSTNIRIPQREPRKDSSSQ